MRRAGPGRQRGQALVESVVAGLAMLPLLAGIVLVGKLLDVRQTAIAASRAVAFECTVRLSECADPAGRDTIEDETRRRLFMADGREVLSDDPAVERPRPEQRRAGWTDRAGRPMLDRLQDVQVGLDTGRLDAPRSHLRGSRARIAAAGLELLDDVAGPTRFGLQTWAGLQTARVRVRVEPGDLAGLASLRFDARTTILADGWAASAPEGDAASVRTRVEAGARPGLLPPAVDVGYLGVRGLMAAMHALRLEPAAGAYRHGWIDMDVVPADRRPTP